LGLATARVLARAGREVLVLEASVVGHAGAGSKGTARIFRLGYPDPRYVRMAQAAERHWRELEAESGRALLHTTGQIDFGEGMDAVAAALGEAGAPIVVLGAAEVAERWPALCARGRAIYEPSSGVLAADECLAALGDGVEVLEGVRVTGLVDDGREVEVRGGREVYGARVAIVCAGARTMALLDALVRVPLQASLEQVAYFALSGVTPAPPIFIEWGTPALYGLPEPDGQRYKMAFHGNGPVVDPVTAAFEADPAMVGALGEAARRLLPALDPVPVTTERCVYDNTADTDFIVDRVGRVVIGAGTSGHGFKFGPLLGEALADLATGTTPSIDLERFALSRATLN